MNITVLICTHNRGSLLWDTLNSFFAPRFDLGVSYELIVVDNNSKDSTADIIREFIDRFPGKIKYIFEKRVGLSNARNAGIRVSKGEIIAFTDDDVFFDPQWINEVVKIFREYPDAACMGGKSIPVFDGSRPDWITDDLLGIYGSTNSGESIRYMEFPEHPYGLNMAFRKEVFKKVGMFNPKLGRVKESLISNEEKEFFWRVNKAGLKTIYTPNAIVKHRISIERLQKKWVLNRFYWQAISDVIFLQMHSPESKSTLLKEAFADLSKAGQTILGKYPFHLKKAYWHLQNSKFQQWVHASCKLGLARQKIREALTKSRPNT